MEILTALDTVEKNGRPTVIIAHTVKGKGVSFAENVVSFHNGTLSQEQYNQALPSWHNRGGSRMEFNNQRKAYGAALMDRG